MIKCFVPSIWNELINSAFFISSLLTAAEECCLLTCQLLYIFILERETLFQLSLSLKCPPMMNQCLLVGLSRFANFHFPFLSVSRENSQIPEFLCFDSLISSKLVQQFVTLSRQSELFLLVFLLAFRISRKIYLLLLVDLLWCEFQSWSGGLDSWFMMLEFLIICLELDLQEFKKYYDVRLGRKKLVAENAVSNGNSSSIASNGNSHTKVTSDRDQFQSQVPCLICRVSWRFGCYSF